MLDPVILGTLVQNLSPELQKQVNDAIKKYLERRSAKVVDQALGAVSDSAKTEIDQLSEETKQDLRLQLLKSLDEDEREIWASVLTMQSAETSTSKLVKATWGLAAVTAGLVIATIILVIATSVHK